MPNMEDIAEIAGVSVSTVSKAINNKSDINEQTQKKILEIAEAYNYKPKNQQLQDTGNIGVIFCHESHPVSLNPFYSRVLEGIEGEVAINNYNLLLNFFSQKDKEKIPKILDEKNVDGLILVGVIEKQFLEMVKETNIPSVLVDPKITVSDFSEIFIDNEHGSFLATQYLIKNGHEEIGFISGELDRRSFRQRYKGYQKSLKYNNLDIKDKYIKTGGLEEGYKHTEELLQLDNPPTAIFAVNDINAIYGIKAAKKNGVQVPDDLSFIGFDDIDMAKMSTPPLTTIRVYKEEMGSIAVRQLLKALNGDVNNQTNTILPIKLIERESVKEIQ